MHGLSQDLFETWAGPAASAATARLAEIIAHCETLVAFLQSIQRWFLTVAADVRTMQLLIAASVASAEAQIHALEAAGPENEAAIQAGAPALLISRLVSWVDDLWCRAIGAGV
ncbi:MULTISPECIES: hypothetical protein [Mycobacterium]|uniref:hypothetical protein n=1 Tax=Mycobacterium TaxID=1763 RepID=UPI001F45A434|nr:MULTISPECIES: hypothetical protein [Mycobacterium]